MTLCILQGGVFIYIRVRTLVGACIPQECIYWAPQDRLCDKMLKYLGQAHVRHTYIIIRYSGIYNVVLWHVSALPFCQSVDERLHPLLVWYGYTLCLTGRGVHWQRRDRWGLS